MYQSSLYGGVEQLTFVYTNDPPATQVTNAAGAVSYYSWSNRGKGKLLISLTQSGVTNCPNSMKSMTYDGNGHTQTETDQRGIQTQYVYTPTAQYPQYSGQLLQKTTGIDPNNPGQQQNIQYNWDFAKDRIIEAKTFGNTLSNPIADTVYTYYPDTDPAKNRVQKIVVTNLTANGVTNQTQTTTWNYLFYASGMPKQIIASGPLASASGQVTRNYDSAGNLTSVVDALGNTTNFTGYNGLGLPATITDSNGYPVSYTYDAKGQTKTISRTVDGVAGTTSYTYDGMGNILTVKYADSGTLGYTYAYDNTGRLISKTNNVIAPDEWNGYTYQDHADEKYAYDSLGKLKSVVMTLYSDPHPPNQCSGGGQAPQSQGASATQASPNALTQCPSFTTTVYSHSWTNDSIGRVMTDSGTHGQSISYRYDPNGNIQTKTDALTRVTTYTYSAHDQIQTVLNPLDTQPTSFTYDGAGHVATVKDSKLNVTQYFYDGFGNLTKIISPDTGTTTYVYDNLGRRIQMQRYDGVITTYNNYDARNRIGYISAGGVTQNFTYDTCTNGHARLCGFTDASGSTSFTYRVNGQITSQVSTINGTAYTTGWNYDNRDRVTTIAYPGGNSVGYTHSWQSYGGAPNVVSITATIGGVTSNVATYVSHDALGLGPTNGIGMGDGSAASYVHDSDLRLYSLTTASLQSLSYGYDSADRLTSITNGLNSNLTQTYGYDAADQLNSVTAGVGNQNLVFNVNNNGTPSSHAYGGITDSYTPDTYSNRITSISGSRARSYTYWPTGNLKTETGWRSFSYTYDPFNYLNSVTAGSSVTNYYSNVLGQRARKSGPGGSYNYIYAPIGNLLAETAQNSTSIASQYIWLDGLPVGLIRNNILYFIHDDYLGRPDVVTDSAKVIKWQASNTAFDRTVFPDNIGGLNLGFPGQYYDMESGLWYNMNRYYDPSTGRYLQSDPIGLAGGLNTYNYASADPISNIDPFGLEDCSTYGQRYLDFVTDHMINVGPAAVALAGGLWPKSLSPATGGRGPMLGSSNPLTSVPRGFGVPGAGSSLMRGSAAVIGLATVGIGFYNIGILGNGLVQALPDSSSSGDSGQGGSGQGGSGQGGSSCGCGGN